MTTIDKKTAALQAARIKAMGTRSFLPSLADASAVLGTLARDDDGRVQTSEWSRYARAIGCQARMNLGQGGVPLFIVR